VRLPHLSIGVRMISLGPVFRDFLAYRLRRQRGPDGANPLGSLRAAVPIAREFGGERGTPVDRVFIDRFVALQAGRIRGRVLEIGDNAYTLAHGGDRVRQSDVLHYQEGNPKATFVGDLSRCDHIPDALFDCIILTQTLQFIWDIRAALGTVHRLLKPGGALVATFPGISQVDLDWGSNWCWAWSPGQALSLLEAAFPGGAVTVEALGNRFAAVAMLHGLVAEEVPIERLHAAEGACAFLLGAAAIRAPAADAAMA
jgi:SAM-dependent methyltransferase